MNLYSALLDKWVLKNEQAIDISQITTVALSLLVASKESYAADGHPHYGASPCSRAARGGVDAWGWTSDFLTFKHTFPNPQKHCVHECDPSVQ